MTEGTTSLQPKRRPQVQVSITDNLSKHMVLTKLAFYGETSVYSKCYLVHSHNYIVKSDLQHEYTEYELTLMLLNVS